MPNGAPDEMWPFATLLGLAVVVTAVGGAIYFLFTEALKCS